MLLGNKLSDRRKDWAATDKIMCNFITLFLCILIDHNKSQTRQKQKCNFFLV